MRYEVTEADATRLDNLFTYHLPFVNQGQRYDRIRGYARGFAQYLYEMCPPSPERTLAIRDLESCVMRANQSIAINEVPE